MASNKLTTSSIKGFTYSGRKLDSGYSRDLRWDSVVPGLSVRVYPSGEKAFVLYYRLRGRQRLMRLGRFGVELTLDQARDRAKDELGKVRKGRDPLEEQRSAGRGTSFGELITYFLEKHVEAKGLKTAGQIRRRLIRNIPASWKSRSTEAITNWEIEALHQKIGETRPYEANRLLENLRTMFRHAPRWKFLAGDALNPTAGITKFKERKRKWWVTPDELPRLARAIDREPNVYVRAAFWLYLLTGARKTELLQAKWADIDWNRGSLRLPETKSGDEQQVTLSAAALAILQSVPRLDDNPYILPGAKRGQHLVNIDKAWHRVRKVAGVEDVRLHDLRRTTGSWLSQAGVDLNVIKSALRHANLATTLVYSRLGADPAREAMEAHGRRILEAAGKRGPVEVVTGGGTD